MWKNKSLVRVNYPKTHTQKQNINLKKKKRGSDCRGSLLDYLAMLPYSQLRKVRFYLRPIHTTDRRLTMATDTSSGCQISV